MSLELPITWLEDDIWTRVRIGSQYLPTGEFQMVPTFLFNRFGHKEPKVYKATATLSKTRDGALSTAPLVRYALKYPDLGRELLIWFEEAFPYSILKWQEIYRDGFGDSPKILITEGVKNKSIMIDYWSRNGVADSIYRGQLGLE